MIKVCELIGRSLANFNRHLFFPAFYIELPFSPSPCSAKQYYSRFKCILLADEITVIGNETSVSNIQICNCFVSNQTNVSIFHPLDVVGRGSDTQLQVDENLYYLI